MKPVVFKLSLLAFTLSPLFALRAQSAQPASSAIDQRVEAMLSKMTTEQKISMLGGKDNFFTQDIPSIGLPRFRMADGPLGIRNWGPSTAYTAGIALAATWDTALATRVGESLGKDARARDVNILLAPGVNIYRAPMNGRNMEYFGEDPWLTSRIAVHYIEGVQSKGVTATVKHFAANNSEFDRHNSDSIIDERTLREIYLPAFEAAVKEAHVGAVMNSYNLVNGDHATQNRHLNMDILKGEWGFDGILMSDWVSTYDGLAAANAGLDLEMPNAQFMSAKTLLPALKAGTLSQAALDDKVRRILRTAVRFGWLDRDQRDTSIPLLSPASSQVAREEALESITLLKNDGGLLPLDINKQHTFVVLGPNAAPSITGGGGSSHVGPFFSDSILTGISNFVGERGTVFYLPGLPSAEQLFTNTEFASGTLTLYAGQSTAGKPLTTSTALRLDQWHENNDDPNINTNNESGDGHTYLWHMTYTPPTTGEYLLVSAAGAYDTFTIQADGSPALQQVPRNGPAVPVSKTIHLQKDKPLQLVIQYFTRSAAPHFGLGLQATNALFSAAERAQITSADAVIAAVGMNATYEGEGYDRSFELPWGQNELIAATAALNPRVIVDVQAGGAVDVHSWIDKIPAFIDSWYSGQSAGDALAHILFGQSPSGRLPMSWERVAEDNPAYAHYYESPGPAHKIDYAEGLYYGYRYYTTRHREPLFPFGFGLTYTHFAISGLKLTPSAESDHRLLVEFDVRNTGTVEGAEVAQVYVGDPSAKIDRPVKELKGFAKVTLAPGASQHVAIPLNERAFSYFDVASHQWRMDSGRFNITIGESSADDRLTDHIDLIR